MSEVCLMYVRVWCGKIHRDCYREVVSSRKLVCLTEQIRRLPRPLVVTCC